jgi:hypothetical protein
MLMLSVASSAILMLAILFFIKKNKQDFLAIFGLLLKILAGLLLGIIYKYHYRGGDTFQYFSDAGVIANYLLNHPLHVIDLYFNTSAIPDVMSQVAYFDQPRALLFSKIISGLYLFTGGNYWISGAFLSLFNFLATFWLVEEINHRYPDFKKATVLAFYFVPSFVFWTSGLLKESLAIGALYILIALVIKMVRTQKYAYIPYWISMLFSAMVLWELKYFYAALAIPLLVSFFIYSIVYQIRPVQIYLMLLVMLIGFFMATQFHYNLSLSHVTEVIYQNYLMGVEDAGTKTLEYYQFDGRWFGFLINLPMAAVFGLFRPVIFEASNFFQALIGLENLLILMLLILGVSKSGLKINWKDPLLLVTGLYITFLDILLAFSTPNFGTLSRYKVGYWPFFVLLVLCLYFREGKKKVFDLHPGN